MIATDDPYADERDAARDARDAQDHGPEDDRPSRQELRDDERDYERWFMEWAAANRPAVFSRDADLPF